MGNFVSEMWTGRSPAVFCNLGLREHCLGSGLGQPCGGSALPW